MSRAIRIAATLFIGAGTVSAQQQQGASPPTNTKPVLGSADYAKWETLGNGALSPDGKWVAYDLRRGNGSTELRYRTVDSDNEHIARSANGPQFTSNGHWLLYTITPDTTGGGGRGGRGGRGGAGAAPTSTTANRNKVGAVDLRTGAMATFDDVQSFTLSSDGAYAALRRYPASGRRAADVIVRDLDAATELTFGNVAESAWSDDGAMLALAIDVDGKTGNGVQLLNVRTGADRKSTRLNSSH